MRERQSSSRSRSRSLHLHHSSTFKFKFKTIGSICTTAILISTLKLHQKVSHYLQQPLTNYFIIDNPVVTSPYQDIVLAHCTEDLKWLDQLFNFDPSVCEHTRIHIYSKCNATVNLTEVIPLTSKCSTVKQIKNCGIEEYAYIQYILDHYDTMRPFVSFIQAGALTENPHVIYDMMVHIPGTTFKTLSRVVRNGWHFQGQNDAEKEIMHNSFPYLENMTVFLTSWRSMFKTSMEQIKLHPYEEYLDIRDKLCRGACGYRNCNMEVFYAPFFGCADIHFRVQEQCESGVSRGIAPSVFKEDEKKDGNHDNRRFPEIRDTHWTQCGNRTVYYAVSNLNGMLLCIDEAGATRESSKWGWGNMTVSSYSEMVLNESWEPDLSTLTWNKQSQWARIKADVVASDQEIS